MAYFDDEEDDTQAEDMVGLADNTFDADKYGEQLVQREQAQGNQLEQEFDAMPMSQANQVGVPKSPEMSKAATKQIQNAPEKYSGLMDEYKALQDKRGKQLGASVIIDSLSQIGQSLAAGKKARNFQPKSNMELFEKLANQPVLDYQDRVKQKTLDLQLADMQRQRDPNSSVAKAASQMMTQRGYKPTEGMTQVDLLELQKLGDPLKTAGERQGLLKGDQALELGDQSLKKGAWGLEDLESDRSSTGPAVDAYRSAAIKAGIPEKDVRNASRRDLENLIKLYNQQKQNSGIMKDQQSDYLSGDTGNPLIYKMGPDGRGQYIDSITGALPTKVTRNVLSKDAMGNLNYMAGPGQSPIVGLSSKPSETDSSKLDQSYDEMKKNGQEFKADDRQLKAITEEKKRLDKLTEGAKNQISAANSVLGALDSNSKLSLSVVKARMPRVMGEVGNLNQTEQEMWTGSQAWLDRINQYLGTVSSSELTPENKAELKKLLSSFSQDAYDSYSKIRQNSSQGMSAYGVPPKYMSNIYGELPVPKSVDKLIQREGAKVRDLQTGKTGTIADPAKLDAAIKSGKYELVK